MPHRFDPSILREYDIRGVVGKTLFAADAHALGRAFATTVAQAGGKKVAVGYDGRLTSPELEVALVDGLAEGGVDVVRTGRGPTPMLYFAAATLGVDGGIMVPARTTRPTITASSWCSVAMRSSARRSRRSVRQRSSSALRPRNAVRSRSIASLTITSRASRRITTARVH